MFKKAFWVPYEDSANYPTHLQKLWKQFQSIVKKMVSLIHLLTMTKWR